MGDSLGPDGKGFNPDRDLPTEFVTADCGHLTTPSFCWEREGKTYCEACFGKRLKTPQGKAYEEWFVRD